MKTPQILTGQQAIDQFGLNALIECRVAITTELNGLGHSVMQIGVIADPDNCFIDLSDEPAVLYVEIEQDDDSFLHPIMADEQFVLLDDKNQPASNEVLARRVVELTETVTVLGNQLAAKPSDSGYQALISELDQLKAQVEILKDAGNDVYAELQQWALQSSHKETDAVFKAWRKARDATPAQCLAARDAEIKAQAGRDGYQACVDALGEAAQNAMDNGDTSLIGCIGDLESYTTVLNSEHYYNQLRQQAAKE